MRAGSLVGRVVGAFALSVVLLVVSTATAIWWTARQDSRPSSDAIVVLGSAQYNGVPSSIFEARLEHALALYENGVAPVVVTVGGKADGDMFTEAESGRAYLAEAGVSEDALLAVEQGVDTLESMRAVGTAFAVEDIAALVAYQAVPEAGADHALDAVETIAPVADASPVVSQ